MLPSSSVTTGVGVGDRQAVAVRLDEPGQATARGHSSSPITRSTDPTRWTGSTLAQRVDRGAQVGLAGLGG